MLLSLGETHFTPGTGGDMQGPEFSQELNE